MDKQSLATYSADKQISSTYMAKAKRSLRYFLGFPITVISFLLIAKIFLDYKSTIFSSITRIDSFLFLLGVYFYIIFFLLKSIIWTQILKKRGHQVPGRTAIYYYAVSDVKRYVPGNIISVISRITTLTPFVSKGEVAKAIGIETVLMVCSAIFIAIPALSFSLAKAQILSLNLFFFLIISTVSLLTACLILFRKYLSFLSSFFDTFLFFLLAWFVFALASLFIAVSFTYIHPDNLIFILSFFVLSWLIGYISFITPMGLGVRELAITASLSLFLPLALASVVAVLTRIGIILGELLYLCVVFIFAKLRENSKILKVNPNLAIVVLFSLFYFLFFSTVSVMRHNAFFSGRFDLGNMVQTVWNTANGNFFTLTNPDGVQNVSRLAVHSDFILILLAPFYHIWPDPKLLLIIQSLVISFGGIFIYLISKHVTKSEKISVIFAVSFLLNFWLHEQTLFDFHSVSLATTFLLGAFYFLIKKRFFSFGIFLVLALLTKENVFLVSSIFGIYFFLKEKRKLLGAVLTVVSLLLFFFLVSHVIPNARGEDHFALATYTYLGESTGGIVGNFFLKPVTIFNQLFNFSTITYLHNHLISTGYLALLSPFFLLFTLPDMAIYLLSKNFEFRSYEYHYGAIIIPFIYIASIYSAKKVIGKYKKYAQSFIFYYLTAFTIFSVYFYSPLPGMRSAENFPFTAIDYQKIHSYLSIIPKNASVSSSNNIGAHLSNREKIFVVPNGMTTADYIVLYNEKKSLVSQVSPIDYELNVSYKKFYIFKKKGITSCLMCSL